MNDNAAQTALGSDGVFRHRGAETTRLETFVDAAFAFALTLLVISFDAVPASYTELVDALLAVPSFLFGFLILMMFWVAHRNWSKRYGMDTTLATLVSLALVFTVLVYVYPLRAMSAAVVSSMSNGHLPTDFVLLSEAEAIGLFRVYGIGYVVSNLCIIWLNVHAYQCRRQLSLSAQETFMTLAEIIAWTLVAGVGVLSLCLTFFVSGALIGLCGWSYALLAVIMPVFGRLTDKRFAAKFGTAAAP
ncbi:MAG: TMEM175 family protein [Pseudomonadota bacterium]